jgi:hypothetical protein
MAGQTPALEAESWQVPGGFALPSWRALSKPLGILPEKVALQRTGGGLRDGAE